MTIKGSSVHSNRRKSQSSSGMEICVPSVVCLKDLSIDIVYEILGHLTVQDAMRVRQVCKQLFQATYQRNMWASIYERSNLLLPRGPFPSHSQSDLESLLVRSAKFQLTWTSQRPLTCTQRRFPVSVDTYHFDASIISGRYLQLAERYGISWYDLDADDISKPILYYPCPTVIPMAACTKHQVDANGEGPGIAWVSFVSHTPSKIFVLKVTFSKKGHGVILYAELPIQRNVNSIELDFDWLLPIKEFASPNDPMDIFHIPSRTTLYLPMHEKVQHPSDLSNLNCVITPGFLCLMFSMRNETLVDIYALPTRMDFDLSSTSRNISRMHCIVYPHPISNIKFIETFKGPPPLATSESFQFSQTQSIHITFLALVYLNRSTITWTSKIGLHVFNIIVDLRGSIGFATRSEKILNVGIVTTSLSLSARSGICLAITHSSPGPVILMHRIERVRDSEYTMSVKTLKPPNGLQSREMVGWDGSRGRLCLINGWTNITVLDYA